MPKKLSFGFVADPLDHFDFEAETTLFLMKEVARLGHFVFICEPKDLFLKQNEVWAGELNLKNLDALFVRKDPPFDLAYLHHLYLLAKLDGKVLMINDPISIMEHNEKLSALDFSFAPKTLVSRDAEQIIAWAAKQKRGVVLKPMNMSGGNGIVWLKHAERRTQNAERTIKKMTKNGQEMIIAQEYLPAAKTGDKRILLWNGKVLGAFLRVPKRGEFRANLHQGGHFVKCTLTQNDLKIARTVGKWAKERGLYFVGLDVIGNHLTEINVTSPMGIREVNTLYGLQVEREIIGDVIKSL